MSFWSFSTLLSWYFLLFFFFNDTATTEIYTLSLHDALPISSPARLRPDPPVCRRDSLWGGDRKSTRLNSSHPSISYAVFCLKKKNTTHFPFTSKKKKKKKKQNKNKNYKQ